MGKTMVYLGGRGSGGSRLLLLHTHLRVGHFIVFDLEGTDMRVKENSGM